MSDERYAQCLARDGGGAEDERCILHVLNHPIGHVFPSRIRTLAKMWEEGELIDRENAPSSAAPAEIIAASRAIEEAEHGVTPTEKAGE